MRTLLFSAFRPDAYAARIDWQTADGAAIDVAFVDPVDIDDMELSLVQDCAIRARLAAVFGATLFAAETDGPLLRVHALDQQFAAEI